MASNLADICKSLLGRQAVQTCVSGAGAWQEVVRARMRDGFVTHGDTSRMSIRTCGGAFRRIRRPMTPDIVMT